MLENTFDNKQSTEIFAENFEDFLEHIDDKTGKAVMNRLETIILQIKKNLSQTLVTREMFEERFKLVDEKFKAMNIKFESIHHKLDNKISGLRKEMCGKFSTVNVKFKNINFKFNILIALTVANPTFVKLLNRLF